jgi:leader peptidase (prepilin peptidase)/N-methyltransferase
VTPGFGEVIVGATLACLMLAIAISDWRRYRVPDPLTVAALGLRALDIYLLGSPLAAPEATTRAAAMAASFWLFRWSYRRLRGREGLGLGDVKLAAVAGAWVDWPLLPLVVEAAALFGLSLALFRVLSAHVAPGGDMRLPFAVGFAPAIFLGWQMQQVYF